MPGCFKLAVFDVDGTLRRERSPWTHIHCIFGCEEQAEVHRLAFETGQIDDIEWGIRDAQLWRGRTRTEIVGSLDTNPIRRGAKELVTFLKGAGLRCIAISAGLSILNDVTAKEVGLDESLACHLGFKRGICDGTVSVTVGEHNKADLLHKYIKRHGWNASQVIAFGDGRNDIGMFGAAGFSVAVLPTSHAVREAADVVLESEPLTDVIPMLPL